MATPWRRLSTVGWSVGIAIILVILITTGVLAPIQRILVPVFSPIGQFARGIVEHVTTSTTDRKDRAALQAENDLLNQQLLQAELDRASLNQQLAELKLEREEKNFLTRRSLSGIASRVIGRSEVSAQVLLIDVGSASGVSVGAPVLASGGVLVGVVSEVSSGTSNVRLLTADGINVGVRVDRQDGPSGILVGEQGTGMRLTLVPKTDSIAVKQTVVTSDINPQIPSGLLIGTLSTVTSPAGELFQSATVIPTVPYEQLTILTVLKRS